jgi:hypothetical protein
MSSSDEDKTSASPSTDVEDEDESEEETNSSSSSAISKTKTSTRIKSRGQETIKVIDYKESSESEEDEITERGIVHPTADVTNEIAASHIDTVEKVLSHRDGVPHATGPDTTWYNIEVLL